MKQKFLRITFVTLLLAALISSASCSAFGTSFKSEELKPLISAPELSLMDHQGNPFQLGGMRGKVVLLFFGFTNCVNECPLTMAHLKLALEMLGDKSADVQVALITTDPVRDTPQVLQNFLGKFNPAFLGITGTADELTHTWDAYSIEVMHGGETHSSFTYAIDKEGQLRLKIPVGATPEDIAADLKILLDED